jgi:hypothetical protein
MYPQALSRTVRTMLKTQQATTGKMNRTRITAPNLSLRAGGACHGLDIPGGDHDTLGGSDGLAP